ncbi:unnamed protein product [Agarophyton chilense]
MSAPHGTLKISLPFKCNLSISPLDPHESDWTQTNIHLYIPTSENMNEAKARSFSKILAVRAKEEADDGSSSTHIEASAPQNDCESARLLVTDVPELRVEIPGLHNLWIDLADGNLHLCDTIEGDFRVRSDSAAIYVNKLRSTSASIKTKEGRIEARILQGNVDIESQRGSVKLTRAQGNDIKVRCGGTLEAGCLYGGRMMLQCDRDFSADAVHGEAYIEAGKTEISAVQGKLKLRSRGDVRLTLADAGTESIDVDADGHVHLGVRKRFSGTFNMKADSVRDEVGVLQDSASEVDHAESVCSVQIRAGGSVTLRDEQWAGRILGAGSAVA